MTNLQWLITLLQPIISLLRVKKNDAKFASSCQLCRLRVPWEDSASTGRLQFLHILNIPGTTPVLVLGKPLSGDHLCQGKEHLMSPRCEQLEERRLLSISALGTVQPLSSSSTAVTSKAKVIKTVPAAPSNLAATATSASQIQLTWTDNANNENSFVVERSLTGFTFTAIATVGANSTSYTNSGLNPNTRYFYRVRAVNDAGSSPPSGTASATTQSIPTSVPAAPSNLQAIVNGSNFATLTWADNSNNEDNFVIQRIFSSSTFEDYSQVPANSTTTSVYLLSGNTNQLRIVAKNAVGVSDSSNVLTIFTKPQAPVYANAQAASSTAIDISWDSLDACSFHVERLDNGVWTRIASDLGALSYRDANLTPGTSYSYRVIAAAVNSAGESDPSDVVTATTAPLAVNGLKVTSKTSSSVSLAWNDVSGEGFYSVERSVDGVNWTTVTYLYANTTSYTATGLSSHTMYYFRVTGMAYGYAPGDRADPVLVTTL
jgi:titin